MYVPTICILSKNKKNIKICTLKFFIFTAKKVLCILHGHVFVMYLKHSLDILGGAPIYRRDVHTCTKERKRHPNSG